MKCSFSWERGRSYGDVTTLLRNITAREKKKEVLQHHSRRGLHSILLPISLLMSKQASTAMGGGGEARRRQGEDETHAAFPHAHPAAAAAAVSTTSKPPIQVARLFLLRACTPLPETRRRQKSPSPAANTGWELGYKNHSHQAGRHRQPPCRGDKKNSNLTATSFIPKYFIESFSRVIIVIK